MKFQPIETVQAKGLPEETPSPNSKPVPGQLIVVIKPRVVKFAVKLYETESVKSHVVSTEKVQSKLFVIEEASKARPKIGKTGKWLNVQTREGKKGFVNAELVVLAE